MPCGAASDHRRFRPHRNRRRRRRRRWTRLAMRADRRRRPACREPRRRIHRDAPSTGRATPRCAGRATVRDSLLRRSADLLSGRGGGDRRCWERRHRRRRRRDRLGRALRAAGRLTASPQVRPSESEATRWTSRRWPIEPRRSLPVCGRTTPRRRHAVRVAARRPRPAVLLRERLPRTAGHRPARRGRRLRDRRRPRTAPRVL